MWITWKHQDTDFVMPLTNIDHKIEIFYERIWGWQLHIADLCINGGESHKREDTLLKRLPQSGIAEALPSTQKVA